MEIIRQAGDPTCIAHLENSIKTIDSIFTNGDGPVHRHLKAVVKKLFGVEELQHDEDFASLIEVRCLFIPLPNLRINHAICRAP